MAPIKFEEQLKDKLEKRSLQPSDDSWAKLSQRLDAEEKKSKNSWFWWMGIAAGLIIFLAIAIQTFGSKENQNAEPILVKEEVTDDKIENNQPIDNDTKNTDLAIDDKQDEVERMVEENEKQSEIINYKSVTSKNPTSKTQLSSSDTAENKKIESMDISNAQKEIVNKEAIINTDAVVKAIESFKAENITVTDREVDSLLKLASKELFKEKLQKETAKIVDAKSLLEEVEEDMGQSFRSKVFDALKDSYNAVKTKVAERNN